MKSLGRRSTAETAGQQAVRQQKERRVAEVADGRRRKDHERVERGRRWWFGGWHVCWGRESSSGEVVVVVRKRCDGCSAAAGTDNQQTGKAGRQADRQYEGDEAEKRPS